MPEKSRFKILIGERNPLVVAALGDMISRDSRFDLVGSVQTGEAFLRATSATTPQFDVAVLGWKLSDMDAGGVLTAMQRRSLHARLVIFSNDHSIIGPKVAYDRWKINDEWDKSPAQAMESIRKLSDDRNYALYNVVWAFHVSTTESIRAAICRLA